MAFLFSGAGGGQQDEEDKPKSPLSTQTVPGGAKENVARNDETVPVRGEPEGESKQPVVTVQRQVRDAWWRNPVSPCSCKRFENGIHTNGLILEGCRLTAEGYSILTRERLKLILFNPGCIFKLR